MSSSACAAATALCSAVSSSVKSSAGLFSTLSIAEMSAVSTPVSVAMFWSKSDLVFGMVFSLWLMIYSEVKYFEVRRWLFSSLPLSLRFLSRNRRVYANRTVARAALSKLGRAVG